MDAYCNWQPITNAINPPEGRCVLVYTPENQYIFAAVFERREGWHIFGSNERIEYKISHWALPPADPFGNRYGETVAEAAYDNADTTHKAELHKQICLDLNKLYAKKNHDYGDSFHQTFVEEGTAMARIRLGDKLNRFKTLSRGTDQKVSDESIRDTLLDLANYAIMTVLEMDIKGEENGQ